MKQVLQNLKTGVTELAEVPVPRLPAGNIRVRTVRTLISSGTERMLVDFGQANLLEKARQQPEKVKMVLDKARTDGVVATLEAVRHKLDQPLALGYCNAGVVTDVGTGVTTFSVGDRVASNGRHAEVVVVPINLVARIPESVNDDEAAFTVLGAIALQGIRLVRPSLGEAIVVTGLGLIGLLAVQLLRAHGCRVLGIDPDPSRLALARTFGAQTVDISAREDPVAAAAALSRGRGVDAVLITASTASSEPVHEAALMCRKRGRIVLVGVTGLELSRSDFYEKELSFQVSCSYGPGRYDPLYEERGQDYPVGYVRWTEQRNFEAVLDMMADGRLDVRSLITHRFPIEDAKRAYETVTGGAESLGILLDYPETTEVSACAEAASVRVALEPRRSLPPCTPKVGFIGSGNYATAVLIPAFKAAGAELISVASSSGVTGLHAARKFGFAETTTDAARVIKDPALSVVVITTRHDSHAQFVVDALKAGKDVFVEKPLAIRMEDIDAIDRAKRESNGGRVMVGFNRRFAPHVVKVKSMLGSISGPISMVMTVNAGALPADHWTHEMAVGGGRIIGEACHFIDLLRHVAGHKINGYSRIAMQSTSDDTVTIQLEFENGSIGTIHYFANGSKAFPKERLEIFAQHRILRLDNFRKLEGFGWPGFTGMKLWRMDKGQKNCAAAFVDAVRKGEESPIPFEQILEVSRISIALGSRQ